MNKLIKDLDLIEEKIKLAQEEKSVAFTFAEHERLDKELHTLEYKRGKLMDEIFSLTP